MQLTSLLVLGLATRLAVAGVAGVSRSPAITFPKANEYKDTACQVGSYTHHSGVLGCVNFDSTTHSVYFANGDSMYGLWTGYGCANCGCSAFAGALPGQCVNIDTVRSGRVQSAQQNPST